ncbi:MAG TPA: hypothetical protein PLT22_09110 [Flexilinea sp.]|nr:hypothetical protein [Flexilinea sp.]
MSGKSYYFFGKVSKFHLLIMIIIVGFAVLLSGCQPKEEEIKSTVESAINATLKNIPTSTKLPSYTPNPTFTKLPTSTAYPTLTKLPTYTPPATYTVYPTFTKLPTYTPLPTNTIYPTFTKLPTYTPLSTYTKLPTYTPLATYTNLPTYTPLPTGTPRNTYTPLSTYTAYPTYTIYPTSTKLPTYTAQPTYTPIIRIVQVTPTVDSSILKADKTDGFYLIGPEIAPGIWRTEPNKTKCYWKITGVKGEIISNYLGSGGGTIYIPKDAYQIEIQNCGKVTFVQSINN